MTIQTMILERGPEVPHRHLICLRVYFIILVIDANIINSTIHPANAN